MRMERARAERIAQQKDAAELIAKLSAATNLGPHDAAICLQNAAKLVDSAKPHHKSFRMTLTPKGDVLVSGGFQWP